MLFSFRRAAGAHLHRDPLSPVRRRPSLRLAGLALLLTTAMFALPAPVAAVTQVGGDDLVAARQADISLLRDLTCMDMTEYGEAYALYGELGPDNQIIKYHVLRSPNRGTTWFEWGVITDADPDIRFMGASLHIAQGTYNRLYIAYTYAPADLSYGGLRVAYSTVGYPSASFTTHTVLTSVQYLFQEPSLTSDAVNFDDYRLYLAYRGAGVDFIRSTDYGDTWSSPVTVSPYSPFVWSLRPQLAYGTGGNLHCVWHSIPADGVQDSVLVKYRHAINYGAAASDWQPPMTLTPVASGIRYGTPTVAASHTSGKVTAVYDVEKFNAILDKWLKSRAKLRLTRDSGLSWGPADTTNFGVGYYTFKALALPSGEGFVYGTRSSGPGIFKTTDPAPFVFSDFLRFADRDYPDFMDEPPSLDYDASDGNRIGAFWRHLPGGSTDSLLFDAEWRADPGYPKLEAGFPVTLASAAVTPPALARVNDDAQAEIVFGCFDGIVQVLDKNGNSLPGWPQDIGSFPANGSVAVGDLDGDGLNEIVAGNTAGQVYAFHGNGTPMTGWPVNLGTEKAGVYVSIGALSAGSNRQVVACSARQLNVLLADGTSLDGFPRTVNDTLLSPAAIGDVDNDGLNEIVVSYGPTVRVEHLAQPQTVWDSFRDKSFSVAPTLGDVDLDGDLEIAAPTEQGDIYLLHHDLSGFGNGWPLSDPTRGPISSVALADVRGTAEPEVLFSQRDSSVRRFSVVPKAELSCSPHRVGAGVSVYYMPIVETLDGVDRSVVIGSINYQGYAWNANDGREMEGWPRTLPTSSYLTPASGDIDADGHVEVVFLASNKLAVFDVGGPPLRSDPLDHWPMYGYNPQHTFCLGCLPDIVTAAPGEELPTLVRFAAPAPNPARGSARFTFALPRAAAVRLALYDLNGRVVRTLIKAELPAGVHEARWDGQDAGGQRLADGVYFARLAVADAEGGKTLTRKVTLLK